MDLLSLPLGLGGKNTVVAKELCINNERLIGRKQEIGQEDVRSRIGVGAGGEERGKLERWWKIMNDLPDPQILGKIYPAHK